MKNACIILLASAVMAWGQAQCAFTNFVGMPGGPGNADGYFYGTTSQSGTVGGGTIFRLIPQIRFTSAAKQPSGSLRLIGVGPPSLSFGLWASSDVSLPFTSWTLVTTGAFDTSGTIIYSDPGVDANASRFYRVTLP